MLEVATMSPVHPAWEELIAYADTCSWRAGPFLARQMRENRFSEWERVFLLREGGEIAGFCTLTERDELPEEYDFTPFIGFVFVDEAHRGHRLSEFMLRAAQAYARSCGFTKVHIMSGETGLYEKYGFRKLGCYPSVDGSVDQLFVMDL